MKKLILIALLPLAGCISFGAKPPASLLTLTPSASVEAGPAQSIDPARAIIIGTPAVSQELVTTRVPVRSGDTSLAYIKDAVWVEPPARLFGRLLADTVVARNGRAVVDPLQLPVDPGTRLNGELRSFGVEEASRSAVVVFDATIVRGGARAERRRFEARVPVTAIQAGPVGLALNQAANQVADQVAAWIG